MQFMSTNFQCSKRKEFSSLLLCGGLFHGPLLRAAPKNKEKRSAVQESQGRVAALDGRQPACVLRLALRFLPSLPFFS